MTLPVRLVLALVVLVLLAAAPQATADSTDEVRLLRFPDIHDDFVVFVYAGDVWRAPSTGGEARRLTAHPGLELFPQISPDGKWVAFSAEYTGSRQVYVVPAAGGASKQLTFYNDVGRMPPRGGWDNWILGWSPDGKILVRMNRTPWGVRMGRYFLVDPEGGLEEPLALPEGGGASFSPDGKQLAYCPVSREFRTWKRTRGGRAQDIWLYDLEAHRSTQITRDHATENFPMWHGRSVYYTSDVDGTLNLHAHDLDGGDRRQVTRFDDFDVLWPSLGPGSIVYMRGGYLERLDLDSGDTARIPVRIATDLPLTVPYFEDVSDDIAWASISPSGARVVFDARGDLFSVPVEHGPTRNLTATPGVREIQPEWSPDGNWIAYLSDASGGYEFYVREVGSTKPPRRLTKRGEVWRFPPAWSPDSTHLAFADRDRRLMLLRVEDGKLTEVDRGEFRDLTTFAWSPDSRWLVYEKTHATRLGGIAVHSLDRGESFMLGDGLTNDYDPVFSEDGTHLFFFSDRDYNLTFSSFEFNYLYTRSGRVYAAALDPDADALFPPRSDEEEGTASEDDGEKDDGDDESDDSESLRVEPDGFVARTIALPTLPSGNYTGLAAAEGAVFYLRGNPSGAPTLYRFDLAGRKEEKVLDSVRAYGLSADGKKLLYLSGSSWGVVDAKPGQKAKALDLSGLKLKIDPREEWRQIYDDAWRLTRDWFYDPDMHGKDWKALGEQYRALLPHVAHRADLDFILGELLGELDAGHTYVGSGDEPRIERVQGGLLGCELSPDSRSDRFVISKIYQGENWDAAWRSPLTEPGVNVREFEYLLAIDGSDVTTRDNPYRFLENKANTPVTLTIADNAGGKDSRDVTVVPVSSEGNLRYLDWVKGRMALTDELSGGRVGYIHLPNTAGSGNRMLQKLFYSQISKPALIIDDRYNGGGFIPDRMIEYLTRKTLVYWARRDIESMRTPGFAHDGPKAMLINGYSSSGGDALPYFFRQNDLGPLVGTRTWGGLIGLTGNPNFVDGGNVRIPTFRIYDTDGNWVVENEGVDPDVEVVDLPEARIAGRDPSLEKAVEMMLDELDRSPVAPPGIPDPPDMSNLGR